MKYITKDKILNLEDVPTYILIKIFRISKMIICVNIFIKIIMFEQ